MPTSKPRILIALDVWRSWESNNSVQGEMCVNGVYFCTTLEPARSTPVWPGHPCIYAGRFNLALTKSPHFGYVTPEVLGVQGRSEIRIHRANWPVELKGCTAVGYTRSTDFCGASKAAFGDLMLTLDTADDLVIEYHDSPKPGGTEEALGRTYATHDTRPPRASQGGDNA